MAKNVINVKLDIGISLIVNHATVMVMRQHVMLKQENV